METKPLVLMGGVYDSEADADTDYEDTKVLNRNGFGIFDAAVIRKDDNGTIHVNTTPVARWTERWRRSRPSCR